jgi:hypothetical protein
LSWTVAMNDNLYVGSSLETPAVSITYPQDAATWQAVVTLDGALCPGQCIDWVVEPVFSGTTIPNFEALVVTELCDSVTLTWDGSALEPVGLGVWTIGVYAFVDGQPFGFPQWLVGGVLPCENPPEFTNWMEDVDPIDDGATEANPYTGVLPNAAFSAYYALSGSDDDPAILESFCGEEFTATITSMTGGDPGAYGDFTLTTSPSPIPCIHLTANGANDYTGISITIRVELTGVFAGPQFGTDINLNF